MTLDEGFEDNLTLDVFYSFVSFLGNPWCSSRNLDIELKCVLNGARKIICKYEKTALHEAVKQFRYVEILLKYNL